MVLLSDALSLLFSFRNQNGTHKKQSPASLSFYKRMKLISQKQSSLTISSDKITLLSVSLDDIWVTVVIDNTCFH